MTRILWSSRIIISIGFLTLQISCSSKTEKQEVKFYYYPRTNVYFDVDKKNYIYSLDGGKSWGIVNNSIDKEPATLGKRVVIYSTTDSIWKENEAHRSQYSGTSYNIIREDNIASTAGIVTERKAVYKSPRPKTVTRKTPAQKPEKKRNFFEKIFGKNKK
jgi:hypothetical protein